MKKNKLITVAGVIAIAVTLTQTIRAVPITGSIGFSGAAQLDSTSVQNATETLSWVNTVVNGTSGTFTVVPTDAPVMLASPWFFNQGLLNGFWSVGGFTFNLISSQIYSQSALFLNVVLAGTVSAVGYDTSQFTGTFQVANPSANGLAVFTQRLSFSNVPDGGTTALLLGLTLAGLALLKRKIARGSGLCAAPAQA